ncbi:MAG: N-6 DNA methylase, partial [Candidatus Microgenomates bacterium]
MPKQQDLKNLVKKYEDIKNSGKLKLYSEEQTKKDFILPLFEILGWDVYSRSEVSAEETISSERVDYGFYLNDRIKFYLEAKRFNVDIHDEKFANQAIKYSFNKGATWAVLTNFETLIVFNAQDIEGKLSDKRFFEITCDQFIDRIEQLDFLSKESFEVDLLDKEAEKIGKKIQKVSVSNLLYKDLQNCRDILTKDLSQWNSNVNSDLLDEGVQKLLDRLLFIRVAEDRGIEPQTLVPMIRQARDTTGKHLYQSMTEKFREFDSFYNSNLFSEHPFEQWEEYSGATEKVISILYGKEGYYEYDFKAMPADVLGTVYENYLSHRLLKSRKGTTVSKDAGKRKEQGIYYTPSYIVDYIVKNALRPILDKCKTIEDIKKIKVLDPACGSGSFLIKAFEVIFEKYKEFGFRGPEDLLKIQILQENIYGVDLDQQAVEITRLNLLINALTKREKLPFLDNIKNGNSLVSGTDEELQEYFGKDFRDSKPFSWQEQFSEVFKQGGFDVVIGNPPYVGSLELSSTLSEKEKDFFKDKFKSAVGNFDLYVLFLEKSVSLLRDDGNLSFIVPNKFLVNNYGIE